VRKVCLGVVQTLPRIFWIFLEFILIFLSYFYLLEGSKIFFMSSKYFIWIVHTSIYLWEFSWIFCDFRSIFRDFKQFLDFSGIVFALKINSKKTLSFPNGPSPKARPVSTRPGLGPRGPIGGEPRQAAAALPGRAARGFSCSAPL
jgi:hypothetical protein